MDLFDMNWKLSELVSRKAAIQGEISALEFGSWDYGSDLSWELSDAKSDLSTTKGLAVADPGNAAIQHQLNKDIKRVETLERKIAQRKRKKELDAEKLSSLRAKLSSIDENISSLKAKIKKKKAEKGDGGW